MLCWLDNNKINICLTYLYRGKSGNCGGTKNLEVHHVKPFHIDPTLELDPTNLITLCEEMSKECHLKKGHLGNWKKVNENVLSDCVAIKST